MTITLAILALALTAIPPDIGVCEDTCATIEHSHVYDDEGRHVLSQYVFWEWVDNREVVKAWRLSKAGRPPYHDFHTGEWVMVFNDYGPMRIVRAKTYRETWRQYDVEMRNRDLLPKDRRTELLMPRSEVSELLRGMASESDLEVEP